MSNVSPRITKNTWVAWIYQFKLIHPTFFPELSGYAVDHVGILCLRHNSDGFTPAAKLAGIWVNWVHCLLWTWGQMMWSELISRDVRIWSDLLAALVMSLFHSSLKNPATFQRRTVLPESQPAYMEKYQTGKYCMVSPDKCFFMGNIKQILYGY